jgi:hypothetical protein
LPDKKPSSKGYRPGSYRRTSPLAKPAPWRFDSSPLRCHLVLQCRGDSPFRIKNITSKYTKLRQKMLLQNHQKSRILDPQFEPLK